MSEVSAIIEPPNISWPGVPPGPFDVPLRVKLMSLRHGFGRQLTAFSNRLSENRTGVHGHARKDPMAYDVVPVAVREKERLHGRTVGNDPDKIGEFPREISGIDHQTVHGRCR